MIRLTDPALFYQGCKDSAEGEAKESACSRIQEPVLFRCEVSRNVSCRATEITQTSHVPKSPQSLAGSVVTAPKSPLN